MGLDMYLYASTYVGTHFNPGSERALEMFDELVTEYGMEPHDSAYGLAGNIQVKFAYWRKANQVHKWFVDNVQKGIDDCGLHYVSREKLRQLQEHCNFALEAMLVGSKATAAKWMPTSSGFFFGGTDYDEFYVSDLNDTVSIVEAALALPEHVEFYYQSSW